MSSFEPNAVIRGFQLTVVGTVRALANPELFKYDHFRQAALAIAVGIVIQLIIQIPILSVKFSIYILSWVINMEHAVWDDKLLDGLEFMSNFMQSIQWVDTTYIQKHKTEDPHHLRSLYYPNLAQYSTKGGSSVSQPFPQALKSFFSRYSKKFGMLLGIYILSMVVVIGRFVMPAASFFTFRSLVGSTPAAVIFGVGLMLPKEHIVTFLHTYYASRSLMRELLEPYFCRIKFTAEQKRRWFRDREGVLFGFAFAFTVVLRIPYIGVLMYGVAEASTAYLVTKITDPPPPPAESLNFAESQVTWNNKHDFLLLSLDALDKLNVDVGEQDQKEPGSPKKKFT
ncbi:hypothetical protein PDIDSM_1581 [Penicillium digitatum]|nr:hypothetical protein PDIDSM_1581 [Penicillium digitatum]